MSLSNRTKHEEQVTAGETDDDNKSGGGRAPVDPGSGPALTVNITPAQAAQGALRAPYLERPGRPEGALPGAPRPRRAPSARFGPIQAKFATVPTEPREFLTS